MGYKEKIGYICSTLGIYENDICKKIDLRQSAFIGRLNRGKVTREFLNDIGGAMGCIYESYFLLEDGKFFKAENMEEEIRLILDYINMTMRAFARLSFDTWGESAITRLKRGKFSLEELQKIATVLNATYVSRYILPTGEVVDLTQE